MQIGEIQLIVILCPSSVSEYVFIPVHHQTLYTAPRTQMYISMLHISF